MCCITCHQCYVGLEKFVFDPENIEVISTNCQALFLKCDTFTKLYYVASHAYNTKAYFSSLFISEQQTISHYYQINVYRFAFIISEACQTLLQ